MILDDFMEKSLAQERRKGLFLCWLMTLSVVLTSCSFPSKNASRTVTTSTPRPTVTPEVVVTQVPEVTIKAGDGASAQQTPQERVSPFPARFEIGDKIVLNCGSETEPALWGIWQVKNNDETSWIKSAKAEIVVRGPAGTVLYRTPFFFDYGAGGAGWLQSGSTFSGKGSKIEDIELRLLKVEWEPLDAVASLYDFDVEFIAHSIDEAGNHRFYIAIHNKRDLAMNNVVLFGVIFDSQGGVASWVTSRLQTPMAYESIPYGKTYSYVAVGWLPQGCASDGPDPKGYSADFWLHFYTINGQKITQLFHVNNTREDSLISVELAEPEGADNAVNVGYTARNRDDRPHTVKLEVTTRVDWLCTGVKFNTKEPYEMAMKGVWSQGSTPVDVPPEDEITGILQIPLKVIPGGFDISNPPVCKVTGLEGFDYSWDIHEIYRENQQ